jgi:indolepyruvate ferredoxin oxidoreductase alpha subunit
MKQTPMNGDQAMANAALAGGVRVVTSYPGSPSSGTVEHLIGLKKKDAVYVEWSSNERVAMEMGIGASIAGRRALVCTKSVGMNVMIDPLMTLNLTPVNGGLAILLGDDPGAYGSQNDQDSRTLVSLLEIPMMEPADPAEGYAMMLQAFELSERFQIPVIIRETRSFTQSLASVAVRNETRGSVDLGLVREPWRFVPAPRNAVEKHRQLHVRLAAVGDWMESCVFNAVMGKGARGVIGAGFAYRKLMDVMGEKPPEDFRILKLSSIYPLPEKFITRFLAACQEVLVFEENEPYLETQLKAIAHDAQCNTKIFGKLSHHITRREGELFRWQIQEALTTFFDRFSPYRAYSEEREIDERPKRKSYCAGCDYNEILNILEEAAETLGQSPVLVADPGCLVTVGDRLDAKYAIGSAIGVADGMSKAGMPERAIALFGDSSFFHTSIPALCNAVHNCSNIVMVVIDNGATVTTGFQPNLAHNKDATGCTVPALSIEEIARACGVEFISSVDPEQIGTNLKNLFVEALKGDGLRLIVIRIECEDPN